LLSPNNLKRARKNVAHHYDLKDELYELFLDSDKQYSCAYFADPGNSLEQAQADKKAHIAAKLALEPGQRVLDIGCGWGGMALYLHQVAGVDVLGVTLSEHQVKIARERAAAAGVSDHVKFELRDYRLLDETFDRIVSVGMFEHVGGKHYDEFFAKCRELMKPDGVMLLHTIGKLGEPSSSPDPFTDKWIFPGYHLPALSEMTSSSEKVRLIASDVENLRLHYALTLRHWLDRATKARAKIEAMYDERFFRMWEFYLAGGIVMFESGAACNFQVQYVRDRRAIPITRDYMFDTERKYREMDAGPAASKRPRSPARKKDLEPTSA
jgi:cyclopropane-fatty-acyl-phospholipid synthase